MNSEGGQFLFISSALCLLQEEESKNGAKMEEPLFKSLLSISFSSSCFQCAVR